MPDITMCTSDTCPLRFSCYRNEASGTIPNELWQSWADFENSEQNKDTDECYYYWRRGVYDI